MSHWDMAMTVLHLSLRHITIYFKTQLSYQESSSFLLPLLSTQNLILEGKGSHIVETNKDCESLEVVQGLYHYIHEVLGAGCGEYHFPW